MRTHTKTANNVLLTGFGPFPGCAKNPSGQYAMELAIYARSIWPDIHVVSHIFPTEWAAVNAQLDELCREHRPNFALHFGVSSTARCLYIERYARNHAPSGSDNAGEPGCDAPICPDDPEKRRTNLPSYAILTNLRKAGIKAQISTDAGSYLCNYLFYISLAHARMTGNKRSTGFIHIPANIRPQQKPCGQIGWSQLIEAGLIIISHGLQRARFQRSLSPTPCKLYKARADHRHRTARETGQIF